MNCNVGGFTCCVPRLSRVGVNQLYCYGGNVPQ